MQGKLSIALSLSVIVIVALLSNKPFRAIAAHTQSPWPAPEFTHSKSREWLNSQPLKLTDLRGKVLLIDFWSYGCWNCYRSFPWLTALEEKYKTNEFLVVGVHSPEFDHEKDRQ